MVDAGPPPGGLLFLVREAPPPQPPPAKRGRERSIAPSFCAYVVFLPPLISFPRVRGKAGMGAGRLRHFLMCTCASRLFSTVLRLAKLMESHIRSARMREGQKVRAARRLRRQMTDAARLPWRCLRVRQLAAARLGRQ